MPRNPDEAEADELYGQAKYSLIDLMAEKVFASDKSCRFGVAMQLGFDLVGKSIFEANCEPDNEAFSYVELDWFFEQLSKKLNEAVIEFARNYPGVKFPTPKGSV